MVTKFSREPQTQPQTIKKRNYKNFVVSDFLNDVNRHVMDGSFAKVKDNRNTSEASALFSGIFGSILNRHAPLKVFQVRNNYAPWLSNETKDMIKERDKLRKEAIDENCNVRYELYKGLRNQIKSKLEKDQLEHYKTKFYQDNPSTASLWKNANDFLNTSNKSFSNTPKIIVHNGKTYTKPRDIANAINETFLRKVQDLRGQVSGVPDVDPKVRLKKFLDKRES